MSRKVRRHGVVGCEAEMGCVAGADATCAWSCRDFSRREIFQAMDGEQWTSALG